jgi:glucose-6-phosphate-specific signal transduction histidine kinase
MINLPSMIVVYQPGGTIYPAVKDNITDQQAQMMLSCSRAVIGITGRLAGRGLGMRLAIAGLRMRVSAVGSRWSRCNEKPAKVTINKIAICCKRL